MMETYQHRDSDGEGPPLTRRKLIKKGSVAVGVAGLVLSALLAACGSSGGGGGGDATASASGGGGAIGAGKTLAVVSAQKAGDKGPVDDLVAGMKKSAADFGVKARFIEATDPSSFNTTLTDLCQAKTSMVAVIFPDFVESVKAVAPNCPDTRFIFLYSDPYRPTIPNVRTVAYGTNQASYLAGVLAAKVTQKNTVGFITGLAIPNLNADFHAFEAGAHSINPGLKVKGVAAGTWDDPAKGRLVANAMIGQGIDTILTLAGGTSAGVMQAAEQRGAHVIYDTTPPEPGTPGEKSVIGTAVFRYGLSLYNNVKEALQPSWRGGPAVEGVKENVAGLDISQHFLQIGDPAVVNRIKAAQPTLEKVRQAIASGQTKIPHDTSPF
jgi:basic membrane protein A and related proteins